MRRREGLVQVDVHRVDAEVARPDPADDGVEIGAVAIDQPARLVHRARNEDHVGLEQAAGIGVGDHHAGDVRPEPRLERVEIDPAGRVGRNVLDPVAGEGRGRRIGAVRAFGDEDDLALVAPRLERRADREQPAQFAVRARLGAHRDAVHAGQAHQPLAEPVDQLRARPAPCRSAAAGGCRRSRAAAPSFRTAADCASSCSCRAGTGRGRSHNSGATGGCSDAPSPARTGRPGRSSACARGRRGDPPRVRLRQARSRRRSSRCRRSRTAGAPRASARGCRSRCRRDPRPLPAGSAVLRGSCSCQRLLQGASQAPQCPRCVAVSVTATTRPLARSASPG